MGDQGPGLASAEAQLMKQPLASTLAYLDAVALVQRQVSFRALPFHVLSPYLNIFFGGDR